MIRLARRKGLALPYVLICVAMILATWGMANRQTVDVVQLKERIFEREQNAIPTRGRRLALAYGLALLQSGIPPGTSYVCQVTINVSGGSPETYVLTYTLTEQDVPNQTTIWTVAARAKSSSDPAYSTPSWFPPSS